MLNRLFWLGILFSFNSHAEIKYSCSKNKWLRSKFSKNMLHIELQLKCQTNLAPEILDQIRPAMISRFQNASDVAKVHRVGEVDFGTFIVSNLKQSIANRGKMNVKFYHLVGLKNQTIKTRSESLKIQASGYSRFTKKIIRRRDISVVNGKVQFVFRDFNKIQKPRIAPLNIFKKSAKKGLSDNARRKIKFLMNFLDQNL